MYFACCIILKKGAFMTDIHIAITHNDAYTEHCVVTMTSIVANKGDENIIFHIIDGGLSEKSKSEILKVPNCKVEFNPVDNNIFKDYKQADYYPVTILWTMILPTLVNVDKLLYLDCDLIVNSSLKELWDTDIGDNYLVAVEDANGVKYAKNFGLKGKLFFNTGMMLINCKKQLEDDIPNKAIKISMERTGTKFGYDQTVLNQLFEGKVKYTDLKWNLQYCPINVYPTYSSKTDYANAIKSANIVHYVGDYKPWKKGFSCFSPKNKDYLKYHAMTSYKLQNYKMWLLEDKLLSYRGIFAYIKRYPLFLFRKNFWGSIFYFMNLKP